MIKDKIIILLLILSAYTLSADSGLVKISDSTRSTSGFLVEEGGKKYLYTSQTALFGMHLTGVGYKFNAESFSGHSVTVTGPLMVSEYSDVARVEVSTDATDLLKIGKIKDFGEKVTIFPAAVTNESDKAGAASISGIGIDTLTLKAKLSAPIPGTPVLNRNKEVVGVLSTWMSVVKKENGKKSRSHKKNKSSSDKKNKAKKKKKKKSGGKKKNNSSSDMKAKGNSKKKKKSGGKKKDKDKSGSKQKNTKSPASSESKTSVNYVFKVGCSSINRGARLDVNIKWIPAEEVDFIEAGSVINDSDRMLKEYMPILEWWLKTPYTEVPDNISYPDEIKRFVLYNNERTPIIRKLVAEIQKNPIDHEGEMNKVRDGCLHRATLFLNFPLSQMRQLNVQWKTPFLRNESAYSSREWEKIVKVIQAKRRGLEFRVPF